MSIDIDRLDPSIAPGTATISHGGFTYYEGRDLLKEVAMRFEVMGVGRMHAKGAGAFGTFTVTHDMTHFTKPKIFSDVDK